MGSTTTLRSDTARTGTNTDFPPARTRGASTSWIDLGSTTVGGTTIDRTRASGRPGRTELDVRLRAACRRDAHARARGCHDQRDLLLLGGLAAHARKRGDAVVADVAGDYAGVEPGEQHPAHHRHLRHAGGRHGEPPDVRDRHGRRWNRVRTVLHLRRRSRHGARREEPGPLQSRRQRPGHLRRRVPGSALGDQSRRRVAVDLLRRLPVRRPRHLLRMGGRHRPEQSRPAALPPRDLSVVPHRPLGRRRRHLGPGGGGDGGRHGLRPDRERSRRRRELLGGRTGRRPGKPRRLLQRTGPARRHRLGRRAADLAARLVSVLELHPRRERRRLRLRRIEPARVATHQRPPVPRLRPEGRQHLRPRRAVARALLVAAHAANVRGFVREVPTNRGHEDGAGVSPDAGRPSHPRRRREHRSLRWRVRGVRARCRGDAPDAHPALAIGVRAARLLRRPDRRRRSVRGRPGGHLDRRRRQRPRRRAPRELRDARLQSA